MYDLPITILVILWIAALVRLLRRRDIDIHRKLTWVVIILLLNGFGGILYFAFGPSQGKPADHPDNVLGDSPQAFPQDSRSDPIRGQVWEPRKEQNGLAKG